MACRALFNGRLGVTGGYSEIVGRLRNGRASFDWRGWFVIGVLAGGTIFAVLAGGPDFAGYGWLTANLHGAAQIAIVAILLVAGVLIGYGTQARRRLHLGQRAERQRRARRLRGRALLVDTPIGWARERVKRRHVTGSLLFGLGWGISDACPGPIATQIGQGILWAIP